MSVPEMSFTARVHGAVRRIPYGRVLSYGDVASLLGSPGAARGVGGALSALPEGTDVPWWRVVNGRGEISLSHYAGSLQRMMLEQEGVRFSRGGRIDLREFGWQRGSRRGARRIRQGQDDDVPNR
jgi:methylated-DNA-protein-cysteine methyltransferase related protein